ncbi:MAG: hypothetical protein KAI43_02040 [Candidatus Aureabacteria bacterium]|nr:hypothetical protein [Candidatus Auribacterota bacterium]
MKKAVTIVISIYTIFLLSGCNATGNLSKESTIKGAVAEKASIKCTHCSSPIDVTGFEKGCDVKCPACNNSCTY